MGLNILHLGHSPTEQQLDFFAEDVNRRVVAVI